MTTADSSPCPDAPDAADWRFAIGVMLACVILLASYLSPREFWIDAADYVAALKEGKRVIHPPGYAGFIGIAGVFESFIGSPYRALQTLSVTCYLASIPFICFALHRHTTRNTARALTLAYAVNWVCLNIATVGSSHSSDLLFTSIFVYLASLPRPDRASRG